MPLLSDGSGSWIVTRKATGEVIGEFYTPGIVAKINREKYLVETAREYLARFNAQAKR